MIVFPFVFALVMVFGDSEGYTFWRKTGRIQSLEGTKTGLPIVSISDDNSIRLQFYGRQTQKLFWCWQVVSIEQRRGQLYEELDIITISCANILSLQRVLTKNYINFGDAIFLKSEVDKVTALFVLPSGHCTQRTYSNKNDGVEKTTQAINPTDCRKLLNENPSNSLPNTNSNAILLITPETPEGSKTVGPTYLPTKVAGPPTVSSIVVEGTIQPPKSEQGLPQSPRPTNKVTKLSNEKTSPLNMVDVNEESVKEEIQPSLKPEGVSVPQPTVRARSREWPEVEDGLMDLLSADGVVESGYKPLSVEVDEIRRYSVGSVKLTMQNFYKSFNRNEDEKCVRLLIISYDAVELQRVVVTCGPVTGLTMTARFIKYRRAFVIYFCTPPLANSVFNVKGEDCISRTYFVELISKKPGYLVKRIDTKTKDQLCLNLKGGSVTGEMYGTEYDDGNAGLQDGIALEINPPAGPAWKAEDAFDMALVGGPNPIVPTDSVEQTTSSEETKPEISFTPSGTSKSSGNPTGSTTWGSSFWGKLTKSKNQLLSPRS